jgi:dTDP-4-dehydrorhamnose 3,5-epimerase
MELIKEIFGSVKIYKLKSRDDNRGNLTYVCDESIDGFEAKETRAYKMPKTGTFFGIHYREESSPMSKFVTVIQGKGMDYVIDLRKDSPTYLKYEAFELSDENNLAVLVPAGIGHGFISLENDTIQLYTIDRSGKDGFSKQVNYADEKIGLKLPIPITEISDYDLNAPFIS